MDAMLDISLEDFARQINFSEKMTKGLILEDPQIKEIAQIILACEKMDQYDDNSFPKNLQGKDLQSILPGAYQTALEMADSIYQDYD